MCRVISLPPKSPIVLLLHSFNYRPSSPLPQIASDSLAEQLTLLDCELFMKINPLEYLSYSFKLKPLSPHVATCGSANLEAAIRRFKEEQAWVEAELCLPDVRKKQMLLFA